MLLHSGRPIVGIDIGGLLAALDVGITTGLNKLLRSRCPKPVRGAEQAKPMLEPACGKAWYESSILSCSTICSSGPAAQRSQ